MHLDTSTRNGVIHLHCSVTGNEVARIRHAVLDGQLMYLTEYYGPMDGLAGRWFNNQQAAEYGVLSEYLDKFG